MTKEVGIGSKAHDFFPDLVIKCFTSYSFITLNLSKGVIEEVDDVSVVGCEEGESISSERMHSIFCTKKFPMSLASAVASR